jgi:hypothetical protein
MINFVVDPSVLRPFVPAGVELDAWNGTTYASMVGFRFLNTRVRGFAIPFHRHFEEINLRFYVRRKDGAAWKRGVVFVKEIVARAAIALVARTLYNEPYVALPTRHRLALDGPPDAREAKYEWLFNGQWNFLRVSPTGDPAPVEPGSEAEFITEHYWGYTRQKDGRTKEYRVDHPRWNAWSVSDAAIQIDVARLYGSAFAEPLARRPISAFLADGSAVTVSASRTL